MAKGTIYDVIVVGGGASGMMAAGRAAELGKHVLLLEKNKKLGEKLSITGGGRCNITNAEEDEKKLLAHYGDAEQFLYSSFAQFGMKDTVAFFEGRGLPIVVQGNNRAFPKSEKAEDVTRVMKEYLAAGNVEVHLRSMVERVKTKACRIESVVVDGKEFSADAYIFATGGVSHPETGSTGDGFKWLQDLGHNVEKPTPTIVPLSVKEKWVKELSGKTLENVKINFFVNEKRRLSKAGNVLLTHFGLSGPLILNSSSVVADLLHEGPVMAQIDTYPNLNIGELDAKLVQVFDENKNKLLKNIFKEVAPSGTADVLLPLLDIDPEKKVHSVTKEERRKMIDFLKAIPITVTGLMGFDRAVVADGGLPLTEVDMKTMKSRRIENLYVTGDLLHVRRPSGGYSLQLCWTTGYIAGEQCIKALNKVL